jgi:hypothetical protein
MISQVIASSSQRLVKGPILNTECRRERQLKALKN